MKSFKQLIAEVAEPKSEDELNFKAKHEIEMIDHPESEEHQHTAEKKGRKRLADYAKGEDMTVYEKKMDPVDPKALKGDFEDREDKDINNDGKVDDSDRYLHKRRQAISKAMKENMQESFSVFKPMSPAPGKSVSNRVQVKSFKTSDAMNTFLAKGANATQWKPTEKQGLKSGTYKMDMQRGNDGKPQRNFIKESAFIAKAAAANKADKKNFELGDKKFPVTIKKDTTDKIIESNLDRYMWKDINAALMKAGVPPTTIMRVVSALKGKELKEDATLDERKVKALPSEIKKIRGGRVYRTLVKTPNKWVDLEFDTNSGHGEDDIRELMFLATKNMAEFKDKSSKWNVVKYKARLINTVEQRYGESVNESKMSDADVLKAAKALAANGKDAKTKSFGQGLVDYYDENGSFTPAQVGGLQNIMKNASFQLAKESVELDEISKKTLGSYVKKSAMSSTNAAVGLASSNSDDDKKRHANTIGKRMHGIFRATSRLTKESVELSENFKQGSVSLNDGSTVIVKKQDADLLNQMFKDLNAQNKKEMMTVAMKDKSGFNEILGFAREAM